MDNTVTKMCIEDRRLRIVSCDPHLLVQILNWANNPDCVLALPITEEIPADCIALSVNTCWERGTVDVIVAHSTFEPTHPGAFIRRCQGMLTELRVVSLQDALDAQSNKEG